MDVTIYNNYVDVFIYIVCCKNKNCKPITKSKIKINPYGSNVYNRDTNAVLNMLNIVKHLINEGKRPDVFTREE